jgi:hypothetical protein
MQHLLLGRQAWIRRVPAEHSKGIGNTKAKSESCEVEASDSWPINVNFYVWYAESDARIHVVRSTIQPSDAELLKIPTQTPSLVDRYPLRRLIDLASHAPVLELLTDDALA